MKPTTATISIAVLLGASVNAQEASINVRGCDNVSAAEAVLLSANSSARIQDDNSGATVQGDFVPGSLFERNWGAASVLRSTSRGLSSFSLEPSMMA